MSVRQFFIAQCGRCGLWVAPDSYPGPAFTDLVLSATRETEHDATAYAVKRGWCAYPLLCPTCNERYQEAMRHGQVRGDDDPPQDGGSVPQGDQGSERTPGSW